MTKPEDARDLKIHFTIERAFQTLCALENLTRKELRERLVAFCEADEDEERARHAIDVVLEREADRA